MAGTETPSRFVWSRHTVEVHAVTEQTRRTAGPSVLCLTRVWKRFVRHHRANVLSREKTTALRVTQAPQYGLIKCCLSRSLPKIDTGDRTQPSLHAVDSANVAERHHSASFRLVCDWWINSKQWAWLYCANGSWIGCKVFKNIFIISAHHPSLYIWTGVHTLTQSHPHTPTCFADFGQQEIILPEPRRRHVVQPSPQNGRINDWFPWKPDRKLWRLWTMVSNMSAHALLFRRLHWQENVNDCCEGGRALWTDELLVELRFEGR